MPFGPVILLLVMYLKTIDWHRDLCSKVPKKALLKLMQLGKLIIQQ